MKKEYLCVGLVVFMACGVIRLAGCSSGTGDGGTSSSTGDGGTSADSGDGGNSSGDARNRDSGPVPESGPRGWDAGTDGPVQVVPDGSVVITEPDGGTWTCKVISCAGRPMLCGDCEDNDEDGLVDSRDPECLGPCDNTEGPVLLAGVPGESGGPCKADCYFDSGNGGGGEDCRWSSECDPLSVAPDFHPEGPGCPYDETLVGGANCPDSQPANCLSRCLPLTPNGCDCFGCCTFPQISGRAASEGGEYVWIGSDADDNNEGSCTFADVQDTSRCRPCTPVQGCLNECGPCELCLGRTTLPPGCTTTPTPDGGPATDGGPDSGVVPPGARCEDDVQPCGLDGDEFCPDLHYCLTGCCVYAGLL